MGETEGGLTVAIETKADDGKEELGGTQAETDEIYHGHDIASEADCRIMQVFEKHSVVDADVGRCDTDVTGTLVEWEKNSFP